MRSKASLIAIFVAVAAIGARAQDQPSTPPAPAYSPSDPLANVRYDNRYDLSLGAAYVHIKAGPPPLQMGANLGGLDLSGSYWLTQRWGIEATARPYVGTSGAGVNSLNIKGPFVAQYVFAGGVEWLGPHNKHASLKAHAMIGGAYGDFEKDLRGNPPSAVEFFNNQMTMAAVIGGHIDLYRSPQWVFRVTPDAVNTRYSINYGNRDTYSYWNFAISVGLQYKFKKKR